MEKIISYYDYYVYYVYKIKKKNFKIKQSDEKKKVVFLGMWKWKQLLMQ